MIAKQRKLVAHTLGRLSAWLDYRRHAIENPKAWEYWRMRQEGKETVDEERGPGYYLTLGVTYADPYADPWITKMSSGNTGIFKLLSYQAFSDPYDMVRKAQYMFMGYENVKPVNDCTFLEFLDIYAKPLVAE